MSVSALNNLDAAATTRAAAHKSLRKAADELVGEVFYGTLLRQMRDAPLKGKYGHGGRGEEVFQAQLDQVLASRAGQASNSNLADAIVDRYERNAEAAADYRSALRTRLVELQHMGVTTHAPGGEVAK
ncbi:MAG TPA: rod-binding protein [Phycisphaerae bacterium]|nr:rod-binding protein [Phycisphaerae bacterium]